ncbi:MAG: hypothetical protein ACRCVU_05425 [Flavobacterium sp.]
MNKVYKIGTYIFLGLFLSFLSIKLKSSFIEELCDYILPLLSILFAINIANNTIIVSKLYEVSKEKKYSFKSILKNLKISYYEQFFIIGITLLACIFRSSEILRTQFGLDLIKAVFDAILFFSFIYYIDIILNLGKAIFYLIKK